MPKARKQKFNWKTLVDKMETATGGDIPWMARCEPDEWHELLINLATVVEAHDAGPEEKWSCFRCNAIISDEDVEEIEIPFWAMQSFTAAVADTGDRNEEGWLEMKYMRTFDQSGRNTARFK